MQGGYVEPGPGGDPIRNPGVLPTGKNIHALDPQAIPTQAAVKSARIVVERCARQCMLLQICLLRLCWMRHALLHSMQVNIIVCCETFTCCPFQPIISTTVAVTSCRLLEVQKAENGNKWPETIAVVLWGTDNIKTYGESLAQVRH